MKNITRKINIKKIMTFIVMFVVGFQVVLYIALNLLIVETPLIPKRIKVETSDLKFENCEVTFIENKYNDYDFLCNNELLVSVSYKGTKDKINYKQISIVSTTIELRPKIS